MNQQKPTRPRMKRKTRRKEGMPSKELLLVRLHVSGLGLEPRWLLNRLKTKTVLIDNKSSPARLLLLKPESQRRQLLEQGAGKGPCCGVFKEQVIALDA